MKRHLFIASMIMLICTGCSTPSATNTTNTKPIPLQIPKEIPKNFLDETCKDAGSIYATHEEIGYTPLTLAQQRTWQESKPVFIPINNLVKNMQKYGIDKDFNMGIIYVTDAIGKKNETSSNLWINLERFGSNKGVNGIDYRFNLNGRENDMSLSHQILPDERTEIINYINLVTDNPQESNTILDELLQRYHTKVTNKETIDDIKMTKQYGGNITYQLFVADLEKNGRLYELVGNERNIKDMPWCHYSMIGGFYIR